MNDTITLQRSVVEQVLEAFTRGCPPDCKDGMTDSGGVYPWGEPALIRCPACRAFDALRAALEQPQVEQEPAAKIIGMDEFGPMLLWNRAWTDFPVGTKFYTRPQPKRQPLTDDERQDVYAKAIKAINNDPHLSWRDAIVFETERAHGIGGEA